MLRKKIYKGESAFCYMNKKSQIAKNNIKKKLLNKDWSLFDRECPICKNFSKLETISNINKYNIMQNIVVCQKCGMIFYTNAIDYKSTQEFYNNYYIDLCIGGMDSKDIFECQKQRGKIVLKCLQEYISKSPRNILEIGCGSAGISYVLSQHYEECNFYGLDYRSEDIEFAKSNGIRIFEYSDNVYEQLRDIKFDIIIAYHVVEHFVDLHEELSKIRKLMDIDTLLYVGVPGVLETYKHYEYFIQSLSMDHNFYFTANTLNKVMSMNGFENFYIDEEINAFYRIGNIDLTNKNDVSDYENVQKYIKDNEPSSYVIKKIKYIVKNFLISIIKDGAK